MIRHLIFKEQSWGLRYQLSISLYVYLTTIFFNKEAFFLVFFLTLCNDRGQ